MNGDSNHVFNSIMDADIIKDDSIYATCYTDANAYTLLHCFQWLAEIEGVDAHPLNPQ
jgi:hypothetical protein